jgi:hypothetical protein
VSCGRNYRSEFPGFASIELDDPSSMSIADRPHNSALPLTSPRWANSLQPTLVGLWSDAKGDWKLAHESAQQDEGPEGSWVHAYLHREEGDEGNAKYWYGRAGEPVSRDALDAE